MDDRLALNEGETAVIKSQAAFVWLCAVQLLERLVGKSGGKHFGPKLSDAPSFETVLHECRVKVKELS